MIPLTITPNIDAAPWKDCADLRQLGSITRIGRLPGGTTSGKSTISILVEMPDGKRYLAQTTLALLHMAVTALKSADSVESN